MEILKGQAVEVMTVHARWIHFPNGRPCDDGREQTTTVHEITYPDGRRERDDVAPICAVCHEAFIFNGASS